MGVAGGHGLLTPAGVAELVEADNKFHARRKAHRAVPVVAARHMPALHTADLALAA